jgi:hypothetical protein
MKLKMLIVVGTSLLMCCNIFVNANNVTIANMNASNSDYDYIIITNSSLKNYKDENSFHDLCEYHEQNGLTTRIESVKAIELGYSGDSLEEKILDYIRHTNPEYVLLGGDYGTIPAARLMCRVDDVLVPVPSDLYYSCPNVDWYTRPETFKPADKDLSQDDTDLPGFTVSGGGFFEGSGETINDMMKWTYNTAKPVENGSCNITFDSPADLSDMDYLSFSLKTSLKEYPFDYPYEDRLICWYHCNIIFEDAEGRIYDRWDHIDLRPHLSRTGYNKGEWENFELAFQLRNAGEPLLNYDKIKNISIIFRRHFTHRCDDGCNKSLNEGDHILLDNVYFSDYTSRGYTLKTGTLKPTVCIGRACVDNTDDIQNFVGKTLRYVNSKLPEDEYLKNVMLVDSHSVEEGTQGIDKLNELESKYLGDAGYISNKYYRQDTNARNNLFTGNDTSILIYMGHGLWNGYEMGIYNSDISKFKNNNPFFEYSTGCTVGAFDKEDCYAEHLTVKTPNGAFAGLWHTRISWSGYYDASNYFWMAICDWNYTIGQAHRYQIQSVGGSGKFTHTLFGDPAVDIKQPIPSNAAPPEKPATPEGETNIIKGEDHCYTTKSTDPNGDMLQYLWDWNGDGIRPWENTWTDFYNSSETIESCHSWAEGTYEIKVKARDTDGYESEWSDPLTVNVEKSKQASNPLLLRLRGKFTVLEKLLSLQIFKNLIA